MALTLLATVIALAALSYHRQSLKTSTLVIAGILAISSGLGYAGFISWAVFTGLSSTKYSFNSTISIQ